MDGAIASGRKRRVFRRVEEKLRIVKLTLEPGASVAGIALANGVNANQVFRWKRQYERGELKPRGSKRATGLVPVTIAAELEAPKAVDSSAAVLTAAGSVTIEFPGRALLSIEGPADPEPSMGVSKKEISPCPIDAALSVIDGRWKGTILWRLLDRPMRTNELRRSIPEITERMLLRHLHDLTGAGILERHQEQGLPLRVRYSLTSYGRTLVPVLDVLCSWGREHLKRNPST